LEELALLAIPACREAQRRHRLQCPRTGRGRGRKPAYEDWQLMVMIVCAVLKKRKSISAQYSWVEQNAPVLTRALGLARVPSRSTFYQRHPRLWPLAQAAVRAQGRLALREHVCDAEVVAADKSLLHARGPEWNQKDRKRGVIPKGLRGVDRGADWGYSEYHGWVWGYSFEVVVTATRRSVVFPLLASCDTASANEHRTFPTKIIQLPRPTRDVLADPGYDGNDEADAVELDRRERPNGRHFLCPPQKGFVSAVPERGKRERQRRRRVKRLGRLRSRRGRTLYARRKQTVEPFNGTFKALFELYDHAWHRGLDHNRTQVLCAIFAYQLLVRYHWKTGERDAQVQYLLDGL
jgi:hypothetical protein